VKAIGDLDGVWGALRGAVGKRTSPITCDDFYTRMILKPSCKSGSCILREQVNWTMRVKIDQDRFIILAFAIGPFIHSEGMWRWPPGQSGTLHQPHQRIRAGWHSVALSDPRSQLTADI